MEIIISYLKPSYPLYIPTGLVEKFKVLHVFSWIWMGAVLVPDFVACLFWLIRRGLTRAQGEEGLDLREPRRPGP